MITMVVMVFALQASQSTFYVFFSNVTVYWESTHNHL